MPANDPAGPIVSELVEEDPSFADVVADFVEQLPQRIRQFEETLEANDWERFRSYAHQLKGAGSGYGFPMLTELGKQMEQAAIGAQLEECNRTLEELKSIIARVVVSPE
ncbi:MAG: Hpt domain-containing protein [Planctomycetes bacterium]|nr:Hpt domain-containing protein [Planctomycetota bacterium]